MLYTSTDEEVGALIEKYRNMKEKLEKNLLMMHIRSDGHLSLNDVYNMPYKLRNLYVEANNEFVEEQNKKYNK